jgi:hypothetical protein
LLRGETHDNVFYQQVWGFHSHQLDEPVIISENPAANLCVVVETNRAYFLHSSNRNQCTDMMLAFGDLLPGSTAEASGRVLIKPGKAKELLNMPGIR